MCAFQWTKNSLLVYQVSTLLFIQSIRFAKNSRKIYSWSREDNLTRGLSQQKK